LETTQNIDIASLCITYLELKHTDFLHLSLATNLCQFGIIT